MPRVMTCLTCGPVEPAMVTYGHRAWECRLCGGTVLKPSRERRQAVSDQQATTCPTCDERTLTGPAGGGTGTCSTCGRRHIVARAVPPRPAPTEQAPDPRRPADRRRQRLQ